MNARNAHDEYVQRRALATRWLFENRDAPTWVNWPVLTEANGAPNSLKISQQHAVQIWTDLIVNGMLIVSPVRHNNDTVYHLNFSDFGKWKEMMSPPGMPRRVWRFITGVLFRHPMLVGVLSCMLGFYLKDIVIGKDLLRLRSRVESVETDLGNMSKREALKELEHATQLQKLQHALDSLDIEVSKHQQMMAAMQTRSARKAEHQLR